MILDASAFIIALGDESVPASFAGEDLIAPDLIVPETLNVFWKIARRSARSATIDRPRAAR